MRQEIYNEKYGLAYGRDHICGNFLQIWKLDPKHSTRSFENQPDDSNLVVNRDEFGKGRLSVEEIVKIAEEYGFDLSQELGEKTISYDN